MLRVPPSFIRLVPSVLGLLVTLAMLGLTEAAVYARVSLLLGLASLLNSLCFHVSRNLIVYRHRLGVADDALHGGWAMGAVMAVSAVLATWCAHLVEGVEAAAVAVFVLAQSIFERDIEYSRSAMHLGRYLATACARPLWSLVGLAVVAAVAKPAPVGWFAVLAVSPVLACLPGVARVPGIMRTTQGLSLARAVRSLALGLPVTLAVSYVFIADGATKWVLAHGLPAGTMGRYAALDDLLLPACWVGVSAFLWDLAPALARLRQAAWPKRLVRGAAVPAVVALVAAGVATVGPAPLRDAASVLLCNLLAALASTACMAPLVLAGHVRMACGTALLGIATCMAAAGMASRIAHAGPATVALAMASVHAAVVLVAACAVRRVTTRCPGHAGEGHGPAAVS